MSFRITLAPSQRNFEADVGEPLLQAAIRQGIGLPYGCKDGACGACKSRLLSGQVVHSPHQEKALSAAEAAAGMILTCCATAQTDCEIEARGVAAEGEYPVSKLPGRILSMERATPDVMRLRVQLPASQRFQYHAGQFVDFILRDGIRRSYSMATAPHCLGEPPALELHIRHMPGGVFTDQVFSTMKVKDMVRLEGPFGSFRLQEDSAQPIVLLASGTGIAPVRAILQRMLAQGIQRPTTLYWGCRQRIDLYLDEELRALCGSMPQLRYVPVLSEPLSSEAWDGRTGWVHAAVMADWPDLSRHEVYACGAPVMVEAARRDFTAQCGLPAEAFFADSFTSAADQAPT